VYYCVCMYITCANISSLICVVMLRCILCIQKILELRTSTTEGVWILIEYFLHFLSFILVSDAFVVVVHDCSVFKSSAMNRFVYDHNEWCIEWRMRFVMSHIMQNPIINVSSHLSRRVSLLSLLHPFHTFTHSFLCENVYMHFPRCVYVCTLYISIFFSIFFTCVECDLSATQKKKKTHRHIKINRYSHIHTEK